MKVFLDTNVWISAITARGLCAQVLNEVIARHDLLVTEPVLSELERILIQKFKYVTESEAGMVLAFARKYLVSPLAAASATNLPIRDPDDAIIVQSAIRVGALMFITGDKDVLDVRNRLKIHVLSPREFADQFMLG